VLASGSTGNSIYVGTEDKNILVDAGISGRRLEESLAEVKIMIEQLDGIFITHEHDDHVRGIGVIARKYRIPLYMNYNTFCNLPKTVGEIDQSLIRIIDTGGKYIIGGLAIESFGVSHDAAEPVGYIVSANDYNLSIVTDLGYVNNSIKERIKGSDAIIMETNHCVEMLRMGSYPWPLKLRILSAVGHLSNDDAADTLVDIITENTLRVHLFHRSQENNQRDLARLTVINRLEEYGVNHNKLKILDTYADQPTDMERIGT
jgi:phosphoribosyl 1,2-cyclic phosphodiesterase